MLRNARSAHRTDRATPAVSDSYWLDALSGQLPSPGTSLTRLMKRPDQGCDRPRSRTPAGGLRRAWGQASLPEGQGQGRVDVTSPPGPHRADFSARNAT